MESKELNGVVKIGRFYAAYENGVIVKIMPLVKQKIFRYEDLLNAFITDSLEIFKAMYGITDRRFKKNGRIIVNEDEYLNIIFEFNHSSKHFANKMRIKKPAKKESK